MVRGKSENGNDEERKSWLVKVVVKKLLNVFLSEPIFFFLSLVFQTCRSLFGYLLRAGRMGRRVGEGGDVPHLSYVLWETFV